MKVRHLFLGLICVSAALVPAAQAASWRYRNNTPPTISGTAPTSAMAGAAYSFTPSASDREGNALRFYIANKPAWATFSSSTGNLNGTPTAAQVGTYSSISISVSDGRASTRLPAFTLTVASPPTSNTAPVISGSPAGTVVAGSAYSFTPTASDANGDMLAFSISGKPSWATFSVSQGSLTGTPTTAQVGNYSGIVITVSDGKVSTTLGGFAIDVTAPQSSGTVTLSWSAPTQNTDGSALTNLGGFKIYHGTSAGALSDVRSIANPGTTNYQFTGLAAGTHYFAITACNTVGAESAQSAVGSKAIP